jgi:hypothetical protein
MHAVANTPAGLLMGSGSVAPLESATAAFPVARPVGSRITFFEACSAFTHVTACMFARSPESDLFHRRLRQYRYLHCRSDCYRLERRVAGWELHPLKYHAFPRRT